MNNKFRFFDPISNCFINPIIVGGINEFFDKCEYKISRNSGIKDKNLVEIFSGDIVDTSIGIFIVRDYNLGFALEKLDGKFYCYMSEMCDMMGKIYEVIGNIFEVAQLVGGDNDNKKYQ